MAVKINWNGDITSSSEPSKERTALGGSLTSYRGITTYYPIAAAFSQLIPTVSYFKVPPAYAEKPTLLADYLYESPDYWWVIFWSNGIVDPFGRPYADETIRVIDIEDLKNLLGRK